MATGWRMGMEFGMTMSMEFDPTASSPAAAPPPPPPPPHPYMYGIPSADTLRIEDLLDFSNNDLLLPSSTNAADAHTHLLPPPPMPSTPTPTGRTFTAADYTAQFHNYHHPQLTSSIPSIPYEEAAELEWLSQFVEDSFSDAPYPASAANPRLPAPGRGARSKRAAPQQGNLSNTWSALAPAAAAAPSSSTATTSSSSSSSSEFQHQQTRGRGEESGGGGGGGGRRCCTHCASEKTPQWRTGPLGPKTLCNACGVRYKSGRLVPEYRPAASPTFVLTHHSNSHRKVMELRRQKEHLLHPSTSSSAGSAAAAADRLLFHDYEVC